MSIRKNTNGRQHAAKRALALFLSAALILGNTGVSFAGEALQRDEKIERLAEVQEGVGMQSLSSVEDDSELKTFSEGESARKSQDADQADSEKDTGAVSDEKKESQQNSENDRAENGKEKQDTPTAEETTTGSEKNEENTTGNTEETNGSEEKKENTEGIRETTTIGNMEVTATAAAGVLPEGAKLSVTKIEGEDELKKIEDAINEENQEAPVDEMVALDITFTKDGEEVQPEGEVKVEFQNIAIEAPAQEMEVAHVDAQNHVTDMGAEAAGQDGVEFVTSHFSVYVLYNKTEGDVQLTIRHYDNGTPRDGSTDKRIYLDDTVTIPSGGTVYPVNKALNWNVVKIVVTPADGTQGVTYGDPENQLTKQVDPATGETYYLVDATKSATVDVYYSEKQTKYDAETTFYDYTLDVGGAMAWETTPCGTVSDGLQMYVTDAGWMPASGSNQNGAYKTYGSDGAGIYWGWTGNGDNGVSGKVQYCSDGYIYATLHGNCVNKGFQNQTKVRIDQNGNIYKSKGHYSINMYDAGQWEAGVDTTYDNAITVGKVGEYDKQIYTYTPEYMYGSDGKKDTYNRTYPNSKPWNVWTGNTPGSNPSGVPFIREGQNGQGEVPYTKLLNKISSNGTPVFAYNNPGFFKNEDWGVQVRENGETKTKYLRKVYKDYKLDFDQSGDYYKLNSVLDKNGKVTTTAGSKFYPLDEADTGIDPAYKNSKVLNAGWSYDTVNHSTNQEGIQGDGLHNFFFGMRYDIDFELGDYCGPLNFHFSGDDDFWAVLSVVDENGNIDESKQEIVIDLGGVHTECGTQVNLWDVLDSAKFNVKRYEETAGRDQKFRLTILYMERGANFSNCDMDFVIPNAAMTQTAVPQTNLSLKKVDATATSTGLPDATFRLRAIGGTYDQEVKTDATGMLTFTKLKPGTYSLTEVTAPQGYKKEAGAWKIVVGIDAASTTAKVTSIIDPDGKELVGTAGWTGPLTVKNYALFDLNIEKVLEAADFHLDSDELQNLKFRISALKADGTMLSENELVDIFGKIELTAADMTMSTDKKTMTYSLTELSAKYGIAKVYVTEVGASVPGYTLSQEISADIDKIVKYVDTDGTQKTRTDHIEVTPDATTGKLLADVAVDETINFHFKNKYEKDTSDPKGTYAKYIHQNSLTDYDLTLNFIGKNVTDTSQTVTVPKIDIVIVADMSGSMDKKDSHYEGIWPLGKTVTDKYKKIEYLRQALSGLTTLIDKAEQNNDVDAQWAVVTFSDTANIKNFGINATPITWTKETDKVKNAVNNTPSGGTNYQAALQKVQTTLNSSRKDATQFVIFLTDGKPTLHGSGNQGGGTYTAWEDYNTAIKESQNLKNQGIADKFYLIGMGSDMTSGDPVGRTVLGYLVSGAVSYSAEEVLQNMAKEFDSTGKNTQVHAVDAYKLQETFEKIVGKSITETVVDKVSSNVTITDTLSKYAEFIPDTVITVNAVKKVANDDGTVTVHKATAVTTKKVGDSNNTNWSEEITLKDVERKTDGTGKDFADQKVTVTYDASKVADNPSVPPTFTLHIPDDLQKDYTYYITVKIRPSQAAYDYLQTHNGAYPDTGDDKTDASADGWYNVGTGATEVTITSSEKDGFYSNSSATVKWFYDDVEQNGEYDDPVIQAGGAKLDIKKYGSVYPTDASITEKSGSGFKITKGTWKDRTVGSGKVFEISKNGLQDEWSKTFDPITLEPEFGDGANSYPKLAPGDYVLEEIKAPTGYSLLSSKIYLRVEGVEVKLLDSNGEIIASTETTLADNTKVQVSEGTMWKLEGSKATGYILRIKNEALYSLPSTGGIGIFLPTFVGALLMAFALFLYDRRRVAARVK